MLQNQLYQQDSHCSKNVGALYDTYSHLQNSYTSSEASPVSVLSTPIFTSEDIDLSHDDFSTFFHGAYPTAEGDNDSFISLAEMLHHFPELPLFISHFFFSTLLRLWLDFQKYIILAREPRYRSTVQNWLSLSTSEIQRTMDCIAKDVRMDYDLEAVPQAMFSALRQLKNRMEVMQHMLQGVQNGYFWLDQSPSQAVDTLAKMELTFQTEHFPGDPCDISPHLTQDTLETLLGPEACLEPVQAQYSALYVSQFSHVEPSCLQNTCFWSSAPVTPSIEQTQYQQFISLPATPTWIKDGPSFHSTEEIQLQMSPAPSRLSETEQEDEFTSGIEEDDDESYIASVEEDDEEIYKKKPKRRNYRGTLRRSVNKHSGHKQSTRRTATSYDAHTTHYLKSVFFDIYSSRGKLTKEQRRQVQKQTGLKPRNITYWFSNHKRRFQNSLLIFKKTVEESNGKVTTYDEFLKWRRDYGLSEDILE